MHKVSLRARLAVWIVTNIAARIDAVAVTQLAMYVADGFRQKQLESMEIAEE